MSGMELPEAQADPKAVYGTPEAVLLDTQLDDMEKHRILLAWEQDARNLAEAASESMTGGEPNMLDRVLRALQALPQV